MTDIQENSHKEEINEAKCFVGFGLIMFVLGVWFITHGFNPEHSDPRQMINYKAEHYSNALAYYCELAGHSIWWLSAIGGFIVAVVFGGFLYGEHKKNRAKR